MSQTSDQVSYEALAERFGTPLYVYNADELTRAHERYRQAFAGLDPLICYAVKANSNLSILRHFAELGCGFDIVSGGELARVIAAGGDPAKTVFSGVGKSRDEIRDALEAGIKCFNIESLPEIDRIEAIAAISGHIAPVSLRINPNIDAQTHPYISTGLRDNKFGIAIDQAEEAYRYAASRPHLRVVGIDCHIGSQLLDLSPLEEACARILELADRLEAAGIRLEHIDLGGGIGPNRLPPALRTQPETAARTRPQPVRQRRRAAHPRRIPQAPPRQKLPDCRCRHERSDAPRALPGLPPHRNPHPPRAA